MLYLIALFVVPYSVFVFFGEGFNPFLKPKKPSQRSRWRHGRAMALASLLGIVSVFGMVVMFETSLLLTFIIGLIVSLMVATAFSASKIASYFWGQ